MKLLFATSAAAASLLEPLLVRRIPGLSVHRVDTKTALHAAVGQARWSLILSEPQLPDFSADDIAGLISGTQADTPLLVIADAESETPNPGCLQSGIPRLVYSRNSDPEPLIDLIATLLAGTMRDTDISSVEQRFRRTEQRYVDIFDNTSDLIQCLGPDGSFLYTNKTWRDTMGYSEQEVRSLTLMDVLHPDNVACCQDRFERLKRGEELNRIDFKFLTKSGDTVHLVGDCGSIILDGEALSTRGIFKNVTERVKAEQALRTAEARYQVLYENAPDIYSTISANGLFISINRTGAHMLGYEPEELIGQSAAVVIHPEDQQHVFEYVERQFHNRVNDNDNGIEYRKIRKDGSVLWVHQRMSIDPDPLEPRLLVICRDITERRHLEDKLAYQATHDALTNLINRREFERRLHGALASATQSVEEHVLCYLDLDQFKVINDTCGHIAGDELLRQIAILLHGQLRSRDTIARLGGDEFAVLMEHCPIDKAESLAETMREVIERFRFQWRSRRFSIGVSIGVVPITPGGSVADLLSLADSACYAAKDKGRNRVYVYRPDDATMETQVGEMQWAASITEALETNRFRLFAQPIQACCAQTTAARLEILLRLQDGDESVPPGAFLPAAERYSLSTKLDYWILDNVLLWFQNNPAVVQRMDMCSINLSGLSLCDEGFLQYAMERISAADFPGHKLCFELTETAATSNLTQATGFIHKLKQHGCHFALDDFGSGMSSFAYLRNLPVDMVKIDGNFVRDIADNAIDRMMVKSIRDIANMMGKQTTAESVENQATLNVLREIGVDFAQGFYLGKPVAIEHFSKSVLQPRDNVTAIGR